MSISDDSDCRAAFSGGRVRLITPQGVSLSFPVAGNSRLENASPAQLERIVIDTEGIHWPELDEDLSFAGILRGDWGQFVAGETSVSA